MFTNPKSSWQTLCWCRSRQCLLQDLLAAGRDLTDASAVVNKVFGGFMDRPEAASPRWPEAEGRDHIFTFPTERGVAVLDHDNRERIRKSIFLTGVSVEPRQFFFDPWKDLASPSPAPSGATLLACGRRTGSEHLGALPREPARQQPSRDPTRPSEEPGG